MLDWVLKLLQDPAIMSLATVFLSDIAINSIGLTSKSKRKKNSIEWQLVDSLEKALFQTEIDLELPHNTEAIYETFFEPLLSFSGKINEASLAIVLQNAFNRPVTENEIDVWVDNFIKQIAMPEHGSLRDYLSLHKMLSNESPGQPSLKSPILTPQSPTMENPNILFRDEFVDKLCVDFMQYPRRIQLVGIGGIGKTEILYKMYARIAKNPSSYGFDFVGLVNYSGSIESDIGQQVSVPSDSYVGLSGADAALRYFQDICKSHRVILLVDDVREQKTQVKRNENPLRFLAKVNLSVLLSSRVPFPQFEQKEIPDLSIDECIRIFERNYGTAVSAGEERIMLSKIIKEKLNGNTLIVNRIGYIAGEQKWSINELSDQLDKREFNISYKSRDEDILQEEITKLYPIDKELTDSDISILEAFSIFPAIPLEVRLCVDWLHEDADIEPRDIIECLNKLSSRSWLEKHADPNNPKKSGYYMHRLVANAIKAQTKATYSNHINLVDQCAIAVHKYNRTNSYADSFFVVPFAEAVFSALNEKEKIFAELADLIGKYYESIDNTKKALDWYKIALKTKEGNTKSEPLSIVANYTDMADISIRQGDYNNAIVYYTKAAAIAEEVYGVEHPEMALLYNNLARVYARQSNYICAEEWYTKSLLIAKHTLGEGHPTTAMIYNNIAGLYRNQGNLNQALEYYSSALSIKEKVLGVEHPSTASTYYSIAKLYEQKKEYPLAFEWYMKALIVKEKTLGKDHPDTIQIRKRINILKSSKEDSNLQVKEDTNKAEQIISTIISEPLEQILEYKSETVCEPKLIELNEERSSSYNKQEQPISVFESFYIWYTKLLNSDKIGDDADFKMFLFDLLEYIDRIKIKSEYIIESEIASELCQYTKLKTLKFLVRAESEGSNVLAPKFRLSNVAYMNDPSEGQVFIDLLDHFAGSKICSEAFGVTINPKDQHFAEIHLNDVYIGSFSTEKNKLPLWSLYGDDSKGCCMVFDNSFFSNTRNQAELTNSKEYEQVLRLYRVKYINVRDFDSNGDDILIALKNIALLIKKWKKVLTLNSSLVKWVINKLDEIRFLFKCDDYQYEEEVRLVLRDDAVNRPIVDRTTEVPKLYINVNNPIVFKEVVLGAKVENPTAPAQFLLFAGVKKVTLSGITYR